MATFRFQQFDIFQSGSIHKVGTDSMVLGALLSGIPNYILDIGTGTGVLSLMAAQLFPTAQISALEIQKEVFEIAKRNVENAVFSNRINVIHTDFLTWETEEKPDLIVCNPPYFKRALNTPDRIRNRARHEQEMTFSKLVFRVKKTLHQKGAFWCVIPNDRVGEMYEIAKNSDLCISKEIQLYGKPEQHVRSILVMEHGQNKSSCIEHLTIRNENGEYSKDYKELTKDFHLKGIL